MPTRGAPLLWVVEKFDLGQKKSGKTAKEKNHEFSTKCKILRKHGDLKCTVLISPLEKILIYPELAASHRHEHTGYSADIPNDDFGTARRARRYSIKSFASSERVSRRICTAGTVSPV